MTWCHPTAEHKKLQHISIKPSFFGSDINYDWIVARTWALQFSDGSTTGTTGHLSTPPGPLRMNLVHAREYCACIGILQTNPCVCMHKSVPDSSTKVFDTKGYYKCLGLDESASAENIRKAYRRKVLICHPDKGGDATDFRAIVAAYTLLSNPGDRSKYDGTSQVIEDGTNERTGATTDNQRLAKDAMALILVKIEQDWSRVLDMVEPLVVEALSHELDSTMDSHSTQKQHSDNKENSQSTGRPKAEWRGGADDDEEGQDNTPEEYKAPGIKRNKNGTWWVQIGWRGFKIKTIADISCMERAVDLHIALLRARNAAEARFHKQLAQLKSLGQSIASGKCSSEMDTCEMINAHELNTLLQEEPFLPLMFASDLGKDAERIQTIWTHDLESAVLWRTAVRKTQSGDGDITLLGKKMNYICSAEAKQHKTKRETLMCRVSALLKETITRRRLAAPDQSQILADVEQRRLAITEKCNEDTERNFQERMNDLEGKLEANIYALNESHKNALQGRIQEAEDRNKSQLAHLENVLENQLERKQDEERHQRELAIIHSQFRPANPFARQLQRDKDAAQDAQDRKVEESVAAARRQHAMLQASARLVSRAAPEGARHREPRHMAAMPLRMCNPTQQQHNKRPHNRMCHDVQQISCIKCCLT